MIKSKITCITFYFLAYQIAAVPEESKARYSSMSQSIIQKCASDPKYYESVFKDFEATNPRTITFYKFMEQPDKVLDGTEVLPIFDDKYEEEKDDEIKYKEVLDIEALKAQCIEFNKEAFQEHQYLRRCSVYYNEIRKKEDTADKLTQCCDILFFINSVIFFLFCFKIISAFVFYTITIILILLGLLILLTRDDAEKERAKHVNNIYIVLWDNLSTYIEKMYNISYSIYKKNEANKKRKL